MNSKKNKSTGTSREHLGNIRIASETPASGAFHFMKEDFGPAREDWWAAGTGM